MFFGFDPLDSAPALLAVIVGLFIWSRHRADRRARVFLALASLELLLGVPIALVAASLPDGPAAAAASQGLVLAAGLLSTTVLVHFAFAFPHARPWLKRGWITYGYVASVLLGAAMAGAVLTFGEREEGMDTLDTVLVTMSAFVILGCFAAFAAIFRSYREMTRDERTRYRVPVLGVLAAMVIGTFGDLLVVLLFGIVTGLDSRSLLWTVNLLSVASELLLPLFFFMAAVKYGLLEHHSPDYAAKL